MEKLLCSFLFFFSTSLRSCRPRSNLVVLKDADRSATSLELSLCVGWVFSFACRTHTYTHWARRGNNRQLIGACVSVWVCVYVCLCGCVWGWMVSRSSLKAFVFSTDLVINVAILHPMWRKWLWKYIINGTPIIQAIWNWEGRQEPQRCKWPPGPPRRLNQHQLYGIWTVMRHADFFPRQITWHNATLVQINGLIKISRTHTHRVWI